VTRQIVLRCAFMAGVCLLGAGCASFDGSVSYPPTWPALGQKLNAEGCPDLAGEFENQAAEASHSAAALKVPTSLTSLLSRMFPRSGASPTSRGALAWRVPTTATKVELKQAPGSLSIGFMDTDATASALVFRRTTAPLLETSLNDVFICEVVAAAPRVRFTAEVDRVAGGAPFLGGGVAFTAVSFYRGADASLVVQWSRQSAGFIVVVPYGGADVAWLRFRPLP